MLVVENGNWGELRVRKWEMKSEIGRGEKRKIEIEWK
jgi:hypothetical protein